MGAGPELEAPPRVELIIDWVCGGDRAIFEEYNITSFDRGYIPGEFWPVVYPADTDVIVCDIGDGFRVRQSRPHGAISDEDRYIMEEMSDEKICYLKDFDKLGATGAKMLTVLDEGKSHEHRGAL